MHSLYFSLLILWRAVVSRGEEGYDPCSLPLQTVLTNCDREMFQLWLAWYVLMSFTGPSSIQPLLLYPLSVWFSIVVLRYPVLFCTC